MITRPTNKTSHPGLAQKRDIHNEVPPPRRTSAEVQAERAAKDAATTEKKARASENEKRVAEFEAATKKKMDAASGTASANPPSYAEALKSPKPSTKKLPTKFCEYNTVLVLKGLT